MAYQYKTKEGFFNALNKGNVRTWGQIAPELLEDREVALAVAKISKRGALATCIMEFLPQKYNADREIAEITIRDCGRNFQYLSAELQRDIALQDLALFRTDSHGFEALSQPRLAALSEELRSDKNFVMKALDAGVIDAFECASPELQKDPDVALTAMNRDINYWSLDESFKVDKNFNLAAIAKNAETFRYMPESLRDDVDVVRAAVSQSPSLIKYASERIQNNPSLLEAPVETRSSLEDLIAAAGEPTSGEPNKNDRDKDAR